MIYYNVIPLIRLPLSRSQEFTYRSPDNIPAGSLVEIDFAGKKLKAITTKRTSPPRFRTKLIEKITSPSFLTPKQLLLAKKISEEYFAPLGVTSKLFAQSLTKKETRNELPPFSKTAKPTLTKHQKKAIDSVLSTKKKSVLLFGPASCGKTEVIMGVVEDVLKKEKQVLILIPEIFLSHQEILRYAKRFGKHNVAIFHSGLKKSEITHVHNGLKTGKINLVISTRMGLFLPFKDLGIVAVDEEQDVSFKQWDQNPFYHAREVAKKLAKIHGAKLMLVSATPSLETIQWSKKPACKRILLPPLQTKRFSVSKPKIVFANLRVHHKKSGQAVLTKQLTQEIDEARKKKQITYILVPHRGQGRLVICSDCKKILECPTCGMPLNNEGSTFRCFHCKHRTSSFAQCSKCKSFRLVDVGFGTKNVSSLLKKLFPETKIEIADQDSFKNDKKRQALMRQLAENDVDFLIGTYAIAKGLDIEHAMLACVLNGENWPGKNQFRFDERQMGNLFQLAGRVGRPPNRKRGVCVIQTYKPEHKTWDPLKDWDWHLFATQELKLRKKLELPPFSRLLKITCKNTDKQKVEKNAKKVYDLLLKNKPSGILEIYPPFWAVYKKNRGMWKKNILIKSALRISPPLKSFLEKLDNEWIIDVDPENIF